MDISQALRDTENSLRDFISQTLFEKKGKEWFNSCGVAEDRIKKWVERKEIEGKRQNAGVVDERLIYFADFYDLKTILKKNWMDFSDALGDWKIMEVHLTELEKLRDPDAHRRELLPHQKHLILGIGGEIRSKIVRFRSKKESLDDCFPRIESARDSLGNIWTPNGFPLKLIITGMALRPGDSIDFVITARDPEDLEIEYGLENFDRVVKWQKETTFTLRVEEKDIAKSKHVRMFIRSNRAYHAHSTYDDEVAFSYQILPKRNI